MANSSDPIYKYQPLFGSWTIEKEIGEGSFGVVYRVTKEQMGETYESAVKLITIPSKEQFREARNTLNLSDDSLHNYFENMVKKVINEVKILNSLSGNSNILTYHDHTVFQHEDKVGWDILIRMEYSTSLNKYLKKHDLNHTQIIQLGIDICNALDICFKKGIIHRDIKDENIFVNEDGVFKLGDFGIAKEMSASGRAGSSIGSRPYMAPEIIRSSKYDATVDIYSLGIVLYKLLNHGRIPFMAPYPIEFNYKDTEEAMDRRLAGEEPLPPPADTGMELSKIVLKACAYQPGDRYQTAIQMKTDLIRILDFYFKDSPKNAKSSFEQIQQMSNADNYSPSDNVNNLAGNRISGSNSGARKDIDELERTHSILGKLENAQGFEHDFRPNIDDNKEKSVPHQVPPNNPSVAMQYENNLKIQPVSNMPVPQPRQAPKVPTQTNSSKSMLVLVGALSSALVILIILFIGAFSYLSREGAADTTSTKMSVTDNSSALTAPTETAARVSTTLNASEPVATTARVTTTLKASEPTPATVNSLTTLPNGDPDPEAFILQLNQRYINSQELDQYTQEQISYIRNGIFALSGRVFVKEKFIQYFTSKPWYVPNTAPEANTDAYIEGYFNSYQSANLAVCVEYETAHGWR